jgi:LPS-assembly protein
MVPGMSDGWTKRMSARSRRMARFATATALASVSALYLAALPVEAQTINDQIAAKNNARTGKPQERMVVDARELVYDRNNDKVSAIGDVQILHQGRIIEADRVIYDRKTKRVFAEGNARITEANGTVITGQRFNLTDDFRDGFVDSLRVENPDKTRFAAPRAERTDGETFSFEKGTYTACAPCKDNPEKPPLWQVRAARIIHKNSEQMVYYEDATLEIYGVPVGYIPFFSSPDATVKRKTGFLAPTFFNTKSLGQGIGLPFFWNLAPNYDLTLTPTFLTRQGFLAQAEWRHRLINGSYNIRVAGISQADKGAYLSSPLGAGDKDFRGSFETAGKFYINDKWTYGWDIAASTDKYFFQNYRIRSESLTATYLKESTSTVYLNGKSDTAWFDLRGYYFRTLYSTEWQKQQPVIHPVLDYNKRFTGPGWLGGEITVNANVTSLTREIAAFQETPVQKATLATANYRGTAIGLYEGCAIYAKGSCLVRGLAGSLSRATVETSWRRNIIDPLGQIWTPFASLRADGFWNDPDTQNALNSKVSSIADIGVDTYARVMPTAGLTYRFPFVAANAWGTHIIEPMAQIIVRPNETHVRRAVNEDAQSLVFDDTNLFEWNKFSGYDRVEGGVRANLGIQYTWQFNKDAYLNLMFGESFHLAGRNAFSQGDLLNTGLNSGLDTNRSDYVARAQFVPAAGWKFTARGRFSSDNFEAQRVELSASRTVGAFSVSATYANYAPQPEIGLGRRREGLYLNSSYTFADYWRISGGILLDLDKYKYDREIYRDNLNLFNTGALAVAPLLPKSNFVQTSSFTVGIGYRDECTVLDLLYTRNFADKASGTRVDEQVFMVKLELRTLGTVNYRQNFGAASTSSSGTSQ